jgi:putative ABC transport system substrate-binding protein
VEKQYRRAAIFVDKILRGANPGDIPVEQPTTIDLIVNVKAARMLNIKFPPSFLGRADQLIE